MRCRGLDDVREFEAQIKKALAKTNKKAEAYHFTVPYELTEKIAGEINEEGKFFGPIHTSTLNFMRTLKDSKLV